MKCVCANVSRQNLQYKSLKKLNLINKLKKIYLRKNYYIETSWFFTFTFFSVCSCRFTRAYVESDFPVQVKLRQDLFFQVSVKSKDNSLSVLAENCYSTPTQDQLHAVKYHLIKDGLVKEWFLIGFKISRFFFWALSGQQVHLLPVLIGSLEISIAGKSFWTRGIRKVWALMTSTTTLSLMILAST